MSQVLWNAASSNAFSTTLNGSINDTVQTITLTSITALPTMGGVLVLDRQDGSGNDTPIKREFITYTGITGSNLTGVTRGVAGSTSQSHTSGALVEETMTVSHWNDMVSYLQVEHDANGRHVLSTATASAFTIITSLNASGASVVTSDLRVLRNLNASGASTVLTDLSVTRSLNLTSGASVIGNFPLHPTWVIPGFASGATTTAGKPLPMPTSGTFKWFTLTSRTPVSTASLVIDVLKNGSSIFQTATRPSILGTGTYVSTASINSKSFIAGDVYTVDIIAGGNVADLTVLGRAEGI